MKMMADEVVPYGAAWDAQASVIARSPLRFFLGQGVVRVDNKRR